MTPQEIVSELDHHIVGQASAKRAVAIALRNRWRRQQVEGSLRQEITPKNILMIGPTGVGKTEIARRLAQLADAPFIKVEATKFTEVGYVGKDVDSIIRDLAEMAVKQTRDSEMKKVRVRAQDAAEERILDVLIPPARAAAGAEPLADTTARQVFRKKLREGLLDDKDIEIDGAEGRPALEIMGPQGMEEMTEQLRGMFSQMGQEKRKTRKLSIAEARRQLVEEEAAKLVNEEEIKQRALLSAERTALNFLQMLSAVATKTRTYVDAVAGTKAHIVDTRKTLPGLRMAQKYAVRMGGGTNHRIGLFDAVLIKENHIAAAGGVTAVLRATEKVAAQAQFIEIEVETLAQLAEALEAGAKMVLLDNMDVATLHEAVRLNAGRAILEISGGVTLDGLRALAETGVDRISIGALTKDVKATDFSMRLQELP